MNTEDVPLWQSDSFDAQSDATNSPAFGIARWRREVQRDQVRETYRHLPEVTTPRGLDVDTGGSTLSKLSPIPKPMCESHE
jgi:hypothetical protein